LVLEYVEGEPINRYRDVRQLGIDDRLRILRELCSAIHYAHGHQVVHCDIKPANVLVTPEGTTKLLDFGIAELLEGDLDNIARRALSKAPADRYPSADQLADDLRRACDPAWAPLYASWPSCSASDSWA
jgi:serine/threonine protein kinase